MNLHAKLQVAGWLCVALLGVSPAAQSPRAVSDTHPGPCTPQQRSSIRALVQGIAENDLRSDVTALQGMGTRYAPSQGNLRAAAYIRDSFLAAGLADAALDEFSYYDDESNTYRTTRNVVASLRGRKTPERVIVIGAHFDTVTHSAEDGRVSALDMDSPSPGADDNGTGVAAVLAAARLLGRREFDCTIRFMAFSAEEAGIFGSAHEAAKLARSHERVVAMINLDMLGFVKAEPEDIDVLANEQSVWLLDRLTDNAPVYAPGLLVYRLVNARYDGSDHAPFWNNGFPAVCLMDDYYPSSRLYHTPRDTVETIDFRFFLNCTRLVIGTLAELAGMHPGAEQTASPVLAGQGSGASWARDSGKVFLVTVSPATNEANVIDVSLPHASSNRGVSLGDLVPEAWSQPRDYPVAAERRPGSRLVYVPQVRLLSPAAETGHGVVRVVDAVSARVVATLNVARDPTGGCFDAKGTRYYQPYWGERFIDVFDTTTLSRVGRIPTPVPISRLAIDLAGSRAIGVSTETDSIVFIDLPRGRVEAVINSVSRPKDVVLTETGLALVCSHDKAAVYAIDPGTRAVVGQVATDPRPIRLIVSPSRTTVVSVHQGGNRITIIDAARPTSGPALGDPRTLDLGEEIVDGAFGANGLCYLVSSGRSRVFGLKLATGAVAWAMRTGGVRARSDTRRIVFVGE